MADLDTAEPELPLRRLSRADFEHMVEAGLFDEDERVELLRGAVVAMTPPDPPHSGTTTRLIWLLSGPLGNRARVRVQDPFAASDDSMPQPDLAVISVPERRRKDSHPSHAFLLIEVSDSSIAKDRRIKSRIYAGAGVPEYWIVNLVDEVIEVYTQPRPDGTYAAKTIVGRGGTVSPIQFPDIVVAVDDVLPWQD